MTRLFRPEVQGDAGFTLVEVLTVLAVMGIVLGMAVTAFTTYQVQAQHRGASDELHSTLRMAGERALSEQRTYCVHISSNDWDLYRNSCSTSVGSLVETRSPSSRSRLTVTPAFTTTGAVSDCPTAAGDCVYFYPRGNSSTGSVTISMDGRADLRIDVEGLTSRVSSNG